MLCWRQLSVKICVAQQSDCPLKASLSPICPFNFPVTRHESELNELDFHPLSLHLLPEVVRPFRVGCSKHAVGSDCLDAHSSIRKTTLPFPVLISLFQSQAVCLSAKEPMVL